MGVSRRLKGVPCATTFVREGKAQEISSLCMSHINQQSLSQEINKEKRTSSLHKGLYKTAERHKERSKMIHFRYTLKHRDH